MKTEFLFMGITFIIAALTTYIFKRRHHLKTGLPQFDERVRQKFQKISLSIISFFGILGVLILAIFTAMGNETLKVNYIWLYLLLIMFSLSIGAFLSKR